MAPASVYGRGYFAVPWSCSLGTAVQKRRGVYLQTRGGKPEPKAHLYVFENTPNPLQGPTPKRTRETHVSEDIGGLFRKASVPLERAEEKRWSNPSSFFSRKERPSRLLMEPTTSLASRAKQGIRRFGRGSVSSPRASCLPGGFPFFPYLNGRRALLETRRRWGFGLLSSLLQQQIS